MYGNLRKTAENNGVNSTEFIRARTTPGFTKTPFSNGAIITSVVLFERYETVCEVRLKDGSLVDSLGYWLGCQEEEGTSRYIFVFTAWTISVGWWGRETRSLQGWLTSTANVSNRVTHFYEIGRWLEGLQRLRTGGVTHENSKFCTKYAVSTHMR